MGNTTSNNNLKKTEIDRTLYGKVSDNVSITGSIAKLTDFTFNDAPKIIGKFSKGLPWVSIPFEIAEDGPIKGLYSGLISSAAGSIALPVGLIGGSILGGVITGGNPVGSIIGGWAGGLGLSYTVSNYADKFADNAYDILRSLIIKNYEEINSFIKKNEKRLQERKRLQLEDKKRIEKENFQNKPMEISDGSFKIWDGSPKIWDGGPNISSPRSSSIVAGDQGRLFSGNPVYDAKKKFKEQDDFQPKNEIDEFRRKENPHYYDESLYRIPGTKNKKSFNKQETQKFDPFAIAYPPGLSNSPDISSIYPSDLPQTSNEPASTPGTQQTTPQKPVVVQKKRNNQSSGGLFSRIAQIIYAIIIAFSSNSTEESGV